MDRNELISYASDFTSYLILKIKNIDCVLLYGSVARGDFNEESDVDLFIDSKFKDVKIQVDKLIRDYYKTTRFREWKLKGFRNEFSVVVGNLNSLEWKDLKRAMLSEGIILYGKFSGSPEAMEQYSLFSFENIKPDKKRVAIFRALFGFRAGNKMFAGLVEKFEGFRIGKGSILIPISKANELKKYFNDKKVSFKIYDIWSDERF